MAEWRANIMMSRTPDGLTHVFAGTESTSNADALAGAEFVINSFATGRKAVVRTLPEAHSDKNFDTKEWAHRGVVRFSFLDEPGEWQLPEKPFADVFLSLPG